MDLLRARVVGPLEPHAMGFAEHLERLGYLVRRPDPDDQRSKRIALTERGYAAVPVIREAVREVESVWSRELGPERFGRLRSLLVDLNELV